MTDEIIDLAHVQARVAIQDVVDGIDAAVDAKEWEQCRRFFTDSIEVDFSSLDGSSSTSMPADALVEAWRNNLFAEKRTMHLRGNHQFVLDGDRATVRSKGYAINTLRRDHGSDVWEVWGLYIHTLTRTPAGWRCSGMTLSVIHARGNETVRTFQPAK